MPGFSKRPELPIPGWRCRLQAPIDTVAEGIEQQQELSLLRAEDCDSGQGFLFARPLDVAATEAFLRKWAEHGDGASTPSRQRPTPVPD